MGIKVTVRIYKNKVSEQLLAMARDGGQELAGLKL